MLSLKSGVHSPVFARFMSSKFLILDQRESGILPRRRRQQNTVKARSSKIVMAEAHELDRQLQADQLKASSKSTSMLLDIVANQLQKQKPSSKSVSPKQYRQVSNQLKKGYTKQQLLYYLNSQNLHCSPSTRKSQLIQKILDDLWKLQKSLEDVAGSALVEKTIQLTDRLLFLLSIQSGRLIRTWTRSGARVWLLPGERELLVRASQETYDWIVASLHNMEENLALDRTDLTNYRASTELDWNTLSLIQRLSEVFFVLEDGLDSESLISYAQQKQNIGLARQLLVSMVALPNWTSKSFLYDVSPSNLPNCQFSSFGDSGTMDWNEQFKQWSRWEKVKARNPIELAPAVLRPLNKISFGDAEGSLDSVSTPEKAITEVVASKLQQSGPYTLNSITATFGFLLHQTQGNTVLPNVAMPKTFATNIPLVSKVIGDLPLHDADITVDESGAMETSPTPEVESKQQDLWDLILGAKDDQDKTFTSKRQDLAASAANMLQIRLIPDPFQEGELHHKYPPVEIWTEVGFKSVLVENSRVVKVPHEDDIFVSLPSSMSDLKFSVTNTSDIEISPAIEKFLNACAVSPTGAVRYTPSTVDLEIDGEVVRYHLRAVNYRTQIELNYKGSMVQLSLVDGGKLSGRRIDATLVLHQGAGNEAVSPEELELLVSRSLQLVKDMDNSAESMDSSLVFNL